MESARLFVAFDIPPPERERIDQALRLYERGELESVIPHDRWHVTMLFLGSVERWQEKIQESLQPVQLPFVPAVILTHVGQGKKRDQIWVYVQPTPLLVNVRMAIAQLFGCADAVEERFVPHVTIGKLADRTTPIGIADFALRTSFSVKEASIYRSELLPEGPRYFKVGSIPFYR